MSERSQLRKFNKKYRIPGKYRKYMALGAAFISINDATENVLALRLSPEKITGMLENTWKITDRESAITAIEKLIDSCSRPIIIDPENGQVKKLLAQCEAYYIKQDIIVTCTNGAALNLETAAFLARNCFHVGYLSDEDTWEYLIKKIPPIAVSLFDSWSDYGASVLIGHAVVHGREPKSIVYSISRLLNNSRFNSIWRKYPLYKLSTAEQK
ncbi:DUF1266 domain-containing protein [Budvicia diplopodorum]|uniref:DUF1266 domain-containing protein n=1 Tax=Budvicia diplopodorum TaxID=1119056 RepID=UPI00135B4B37|nr:DUF1266 domain-containing protein [Budvicia diplopodorum]